MISLVVAVAENGIIGTGGKLPWRLSDDLKRFKALTMGKPLIMGRKTFESIGRPLPGRRNVVVTRQPDYAAAGCEVVHSAEQALAVAADADEIMVIGGAEVYEAFLPLAGRIYRTRVHARVDGDARFPALDERDWNEVSREERSADASNEFDVTFVTLERR